MFSLPQKRHGDAGIRAERDGQPARPVTSQLKIVQPGLVNSRVVTRELCRVILDQESDLWW